jgi:hypothetical protein
VPETPRVDSISRHEPCHAQPRRAGSVLLVLQRVRSSPTRATSEPAIVTVVPRGPGNPNRRNNAVGHWRAERRFYQRRPMARSRRRASPRERGHLRLNGSFIHLRWFLGSSLATCLQS